jgi:hypothetical protein
MSLTRAAATERRALAVGSGERVLIMVYLRWMVRAYSSQVQGFNQKLLSMIQGILNQLSTLEVVTHSAFPNTSRHKDGTCRL